MGWLVNMPKSDANINQTIIEKIASATELPEGYLSRIFSSFHIDQNYQAHGNLIKKLHNVFSAYKYPQLYSALNDYESICDLVEKSGKINLPIAENPTSGDTPEEVKGNRSLINFVMLPLDFNPQKAEVINLLSLLTICAIWSDIPKETQDLENLIIATNQIRITQTKKVPDALFDEYNKLISTDIGFYYLSSLITSEATRTDNRSNAKLFRSIRAILPLIKITKNIPHHSVKFISQNKTLNIDTEVENSFNSFNSFHPDIKENVEENEISLLTQLDNQLLDIENEEISSELKKTLKGIAPKLKKTLSESKQELAKNLNTQPLVYTDKNHLKYSTNLFNPIERKWLLQSLESPEEFNSNEASALIIAVSISLNKKISDVLKLQLSPSSETLVGGISIEGCFYKEIPEAQKAIRPNKNKNKKSLYLPHANDSKSKISLKLELPDIIKEKITKLKGDKLGKTKLSELFNETENDTTEIQINRLIRELNTQYGHRFNKNRISCQLKQFINSRLNDPCITYAIFGSSEQRSPPAYYYRAISLSTLIDQYKSLSNEYFS